MAIVFGSLFTINSHGPVLEDPWAAPLQENSAAGVPGVTFLDLGRKVRGVQVQDVWIYGGYSTEATLRTALTSIEGETNKEATLTIDSQSYGRCRFDGLVPRQPRSRFYNRQEASWHYIGTARFTQLQP
jgi:hypothetical protein